MLPSYIVNDPEIKDLATQYRDAGLDYAVTLNNAYSEASRGTGSRKDASIALAVLSIMRGVLERECAKKPAKTFGGKVIRFVLKVAPWAARFIKKR